MTTATAPHIWNPPSEHSRPAGPRYRHIADELRSSFSVDFTIWDGETGDLLRAGEPAPGLAGLAINTLVRTVTQRDGAQFIAETHGLVVLAIPLTDASDDRLVATSVFVTNEAVAGARRLAREFQGDLAAARTWLARQTVWSPDILLRLARAVAGKLSAEAAVQRISSDVEVVSENLAGTYEEISLLYKITRNLRISRSDEELGQLAIEWLVDCLPATSFAIQYLPVVEHGNSTYKARTRPRLLTCGPCPVDEEAFQSLIDSFQLTPSTGVFIANSRTTQQHDWFERGVRQIIVVPLCEGDNLFGWLAAFNHTSDDEFGTVEANLLGSVGALLGIHSGNRDLYRQQSELLANIVRALVSAIDAKDPYTSGHSDRVSRYAVRIALEMRVNPKLLNTIYMSGLLHDVGKIGIDDQVLRKAERLTDAEFEHIKGHPELGYKILADIKQLADVLPAVLHHHEQWDGKGYPAGLAGEEIPPIARIMAVADAYDAMTSDRPYRAGMPDAEVDEIFRRGAGSQWDRSVVEAYFQAKEDIEEIRWNKRPVPQRDDTLRR